MNTHESHEPGSHGESPAPILSDHNYDGIQEYDNPTPGWWHIIFLVTVALCFPYILIFHFNPDVPSNAQKITKQEQAFAEVQFRKVGKLDLDEPTLLKAMGNPQWMSIGAKVFGANCVACHGKAGEGIIGPNLTDEHYKNVKAMMDIPKVIVEGAAGNAMPAWRGRLNQNEIVLLSAYVASLRGQKASGRAPEGDVIPAFPRPQADTGGARAAQ